MTPFKLVHSYLSLDVIQEVKSPATINLQGDRYCKLKSSQEIVRWWEQD